MKPIISEGLARKSAIPSVSPLPIVATLTLAVMATSAKTAHAMTFAQCDFSDTSQLVLNGSAAKSGSQLALTTSVKDESGTAYYGTAIPWSATTSFHTAFQFQIAPDAAGESEGISFVLQSVGSDALGGDSYDLGYGGIDPSVEIEFDTFEDSFDPDGNHVALMMNGDPKVHVAYADPSFSMAGGGVLYGWIDYDATTTHLDVYLSQTSAEPATPLLATSVTFSGSTLFVGFTSATGAVTTSRQEVLEWEFSTDGVPCACGGSAECGGGAPYCAPTSDPEAGLCVSCVTNSDCDSSLDSTTPICGKSGTVIDACRACQFDADCVAPLAPVCATIGPQAGACVAAEPLDAGVKQDAAGATQDGGAPDAADAAPPEHDAGDASVVLTRPDGGAPLRDSGLEDTGGEFGGGGCSIVRSDAWSTPSGGLAVALATWAFAWRRRRAAKRGSA